MMAEEHDAEEDIAEMMSEMMAEEGMSEEDIAEMMSEMMSEEHDADEDIAEMMSEMMAEEEMSEEDIAEMMAEMMSDDHDAEDSMSPAEVLAEEIAMLRSARSQSYTDDEVQEETGYKGEDEGEEDPEEVEMKIAGLSRLASVLDDMMAEDHDAESHEIMADLLAEMDRLAKKSNGVDYSCSDLGG